jgi:hypothetical protein
MSVILILDASCIEGSGLPNVPTRGVKPWAWRTRRVDLPLITLVATTSDRVPRFSRLRLADSVRFVRFNMDKALHVRRKEAGWKK